MMSKLNLIAIALATGALLGCAVPLSTPGLGEAKETAIEVCALRGQLGYLNALKCSDNSVSSYREIGRSSERNELPNNLNNQEMSDLLGRVLSGAPLNIGESDYHTTDIYEVSCGAVKRILHIDMYHCNQPPPQKAPTGFNLPIETPIAAPPEIIRIPHDWNYPKSTK